jgi:hypothetical protein
MGTCRALASARLAPRGNVTVSLDTAIDSCRPRGTIAPVSVSCAAHTYPWAAADQAPVARGRNSSCHNHQSDRPHSERSPAVAAGGGLRGDPGLGPQRPRRGDVDARGLARCRLTWRLRMVSRPGCVHGRLIDGAFMLSDGEQRLSPLLSPCEQQPCADIEQSHGAFPCAPAREAWRADALSGGHAPPHEPA